VFLGTLIINFSEKKSLLNKGLKYNPHTKKANWLTNLAVEAETALTQVSSSDRYFYRKQIYSYDRIETLHRQTEQVPKQHAHSEISSMKSIPPPLKKLKNNNAIITKADKGNSLVILPVQHYYFLFIIFSGFAAQRGLWPPRITRFLDHTQRRATVGRTVATRPTIYRTTIRNIL
jgi:hypothetical protein